MFNDVSVSRVFLFSFNEEKINGCYKNNGHKDKDNLSFPFFFSEVFFPFRYTVTSIADVNAIDCGSFLSFEGWQNILVFILTHYSGQNG